MTNEFDEALTLEPVEAFDWLLQQFRDYSHGKIIWIDVKAIFVTATALQAKFHPPATVQQAGTEQKSEISNEQTTCDAEI